MRNRETSKSCEVLLFCCRSIFLKLDWIYIMIPIRLTDPLQHLRDWQRQVIHQRYTLTLTLTYGHLHWHTDTYTDSHTGTNTFAYTDIHCDIIRWLHQRMWGSVFLVRGGRLRTKWSPARQQVKNEKLFLLFFFNLSGYSSKHKCRSNVPQPRGRYYDWADRPWQQM